MTSEGGDPPAQSRLGRNIEPLGRLGHNLRRAGAVDLYPQVAFGAERRSPAQHVLAAAADLVTPDRVARRGSAEIAGLHRKCRLHPAGLDPFGLLRRSIDAVDRSEIDEPCADRKTRP